MRKPNRPTAPTRGRIGRWVALLAAPAASASMLAGSAVAAANPPDASTVESTPPPGPISVPSAPPVSTVAADGWTLSLSAKDETLTPAVPPAPGVPPREFIASGVFHGTLRNPNQGMFPAPEGKIEVGYQVQCIPGGMMDAILKPTSTTIQVLEEEFTGAGPTATVSNFHVPVDCGTGRAFIRSYAILTRATGTTDAVVAYYGSPHPV